MMFKEMGVKILYIGKALDEPLKATLIFKATKMFYFIFMNS